MLKQNQKRGVDMYPLSSMLPYGVLTDYFNNIVNKGADTELSNIQFLEREIQEWKSNPIRNEMILADNYYSGRQKILSNKDAILADAKEQADAIINAAQVQTEELINEHEIMQRAYAQANDLIEQATAQAQAILDNATEEANSIRYGAMQYTDDMLAKLQYIIEHSIKDNKEKYDSLLSGLENVLSVVNNNRNELSGIEDGSEDTNSEDTSSDTEDYDNDSDEE